MNSSVKHYSALVCVTVALTACGGGGSTEAPVTTEPVALAAIPGGNVILFGATSADVSENQRTISLPVVRSGDASGVASVDYLTSNVTALGGEDYTALSGTLTWADGETGTKEVVLTVHSDLVAEPAESLTVSLSNLQGSDDISARPSMDVSILDSACGPVLGTSVASAITLDEPCYQLSETLTVSDGGTVTLSAGTTVLAQAGTAVEILAGGTIVSKGNPARPVTFAGSEAIAGHWLGVNLVDSDAAQNQFVYTTIRDAEIGLKANRYSRISSFANNTLTNNRDAAAEVSASLASIFDGASQYSGNTNDHVTVIGDTIDDTVNWSALNVPYLIRGTLVVNGRLEVAPGSNLQFAAGDLLFVSTFGVLHAIGTEAQPIVITGMNQEPGYWNGIHFVSSSNADNVLDYVEVSYGGGDPTYPANVAIYGVLPAVTIANSQINHSANYGIWVLSDDFSISVTDTTYADNGTGDYIEL